MKELRIAWLLPTAWFYWQPVLDEFTQLFPQTKIFTALFPGFAAGREKTLNIEIVGQQIKVESKTETTSYGSKFTYLSPSIVINLLQYRPQVVISSSFGVWTILALLFKPIGRWRVIIAYEGSSPSVDYRNSWLRLTIRRWAVSMADACISNSKTGKQYLTEFLKANPKLVFARPYEVPDPDLWSKSLVGDDEKLDLKKPIFLFVGRIIPRKGLHLLMKACLQLKQKSINDYTILIIGDGTQKSELEAYCDRQQLEQVKWLGRVDYSKLGSYFQLADVFILPTIEDTWGMVILEAMLCGKPILCSTGAGASELIESGKNGDCFPANDVEKLAEAIASFVREPSRIDCMGNESRQIMTEHTPEKAATFLKDVVDLVADN